MKKSLTFVFLISIACQGKIMLDPEIEIKMRENADEFVMNCLKLEKEVSTQFSVCRIGEIHKRHLDSIQLGEASIDFSIEPIIHLANTIMETIEQLDDYKNALNKAKQENTQEAWDQLYEVVYLHSRKIIEKETDTTFPSLKKDYKSDTDTSTKMYDFACANKTIDIEKNAPHLEATSLIMYHVLQLKKNYQSNIVI